jgi:hypothetical protein
MNPLNIDLYVCNNPQLGGNPDEILKTINNKVNNCIIDQSRNFIFKYDSNNLKTTPESIYLGKGSNTLVMSIQHVGNVHELDNKKLIIRITDSEVFKPEKYVHDVQLVGHCIPKVYMYGKLIYNQQKIYGYVICKKYHVLNDADIQQIRTQDKQLILNDLVKCLDKLQKAHYVLWDLKIQNIGYDDQYNCIIIDYDETTILEESVPPHANTYYPAYLYIKYFSFNGKYDDTTLKSHIMLNKVSANGLADVILALFFITTSDQRKVNSSMSHLYHGGNYSSFDGKIINLTNYLRDSWHINAFVNLVDCSAIHTYVSVLQPRPMSDEYNKALKKILFDFDTYTGLLSPDYYKIPTYEKVLNDLVMAENAMELIGGDGRYKEKYEKYNKKISTLLNNKTN